MLFNTGTIVVSAGVTTALTTEAFGTMKSEIAGELHAQNQPFYLAEAGRFLLRGIDVINMKQKFRFGRESTVDTALVSGTSEYTIPTTSLAVGAVELIENSTGNVWRQLEFVPWEQFNRLADYQSETGKPEYWTAKNSFSSGKIRVYPEPDATAVVYDIRITSYTRIDKPSLDSDVIAAPTELSTVLKLYGEAQMLRRYHKENPALGRIREDEFENALNEFMAMDRQEPDLQWVLDPEDGRNSPTDDPLRY